MDLSGSVSLYGVHHDRLFMPFQSAQQTEGVAGPVEALLSWEEIQQTRTNAVVSAKPIPRRHQYHSRSISSRRKWVAQEMQGS